jgi:hypothetical protein
MTVHCVLNYQTVSCRRTITCRLLKKIAEHDRVSIGSSDRHRAPSHPELPSQPLLTPGQLSADGIYRNRFGRRGKEVHSEVILKQGIMHDSICDKVMDVDTHFVNALQDVGVRCMKIVVPSTVSDEAGGTSTEPFKQCVNTILSNGVSKHSCVISVGGGVVNNLCGVLAGLIYRGIHLVHFTTTTMGMLDAALGFKQAINHDLGKNLLGCYYPAEVIVIDPACCQTLSARHIRNGIAEALKHGLCQSADLVGEAVLFDAGYIEYICKAASDFNEISRSTPKRADTP